MIESISIFQWIILSITAICIGMSKTGVQGITLLIVPYMAIAFGAKESTGVILPMLCIADIMAVAYYKRIADCKVVAKLLPTAILGFFLAIGVDKLIPAQEFRLLMGWTLALAMAVMIWSEVFGKENRWMKKWWYSAIFGLLGGFTTFSSFGYEAITMLSQGKTMMAGMYAGCSVVAGLFSAITGMMVAKFIL